MDDSMVCATRDSAQKTSDSKDKNPLKDIIVDHVSIGLDAQTCGPIVLIESRNLFAQCIGKTLEEMLSLKFFSYSTTAEFADKHQAASPSLVLLSLIDVAAHETPNALSDLSRLTSAVPVIVLASRNDAELARNVLGRGAKGYIPVTLGFKIAIEAVRFVLAGGTYVPTECLFPTTRTGPTTPFFGASLSSRELAVVRAIQQAKSNKIIAYELGMCESTVKVHVRNVMKKLSAKNRTDVAIKTRTRAVCNA